MPDTSHAISPEPAREPLRLHPPRHRIEQRSILMWTLNALIWGIFVVGALSVLYVLVPDTRPWLGPVIWIFSAIYAVNVAVMPTWRYLVHRWEINDQAVYALNGWITREWRITPISRIQSVETRRGPLQSVLGLATLKVTTASREGGITIDGLDAGVAKECSRRLTEITQATPGDAT
ncbi:PH domain-containing protein [Streptosporangium sp. NBC_01755]|uniref:PH domain-containing protein n=1 Tax=unclassified Streptosporangium TaxID=2632669 RepID=UPI002DDB00C0|nr:MULTISPECIES: PH domain-containing protein [unclassified Streptosporangium]WSA25566.1 PH domain-containing protein [Streptosporangium sp. NBC_01810]WSD03046.1 PH domain-containing protein [Streptosporangium sp. NBC_01755]